MRTASIWRAHTVLAGDRVLSDYGPRRPPLSRKLCADGATEYGEVMA
jgi:hypothetical protein